MKKSLVLAMAMALGVTASAYAANPFSDVPAGHWAYDSISKLAAAGVIEGYGDDTFRGDRLMTRYEMAQIVAKAIAKGANVDKLAAEFADELDALGVRVAALEKKSDNVKITGQFRYAYESRKYDGVKSHNNKIRSRIFFNGKVNDTWTYTGMIQNDYEIGDGTLGEGTNFQRAFLTGRLGGVKTVAGRMNKARLSGGDMYGTRFDGLDFTYGKKVKINAFYGKPTDATRLKINGTKPDYYYGVNVGADLGKTLNLFVGYDEAKLDSNGDGKDKIFDVGFKWNFVKDANLGATYLHSKLDGRDPEAKKNGFIVEANYGGAKANKVGSWGIGVKYYQLGAGNFVHNAWESINSPYNAAMFRQGMKGWYAVAKYTLAKNMVADIEYWDLKNRVSNAKNKTLFTALYVTF